MTKILYLRSGIDVSPWVDTWPTDVTDPADSAVATLKFSLKEVYDGPSGPLDLTDVLPDGPQGGDDVWFVDDAMYPFPLDPLGVWFAGRIDTLADREDSDGLVWDATATDYHADLLLPVGFFGFPAGPVTYGGTTFDCRRDTDRVRYLIAYWLPGWDYSLIDPHPFVTYTRPSNGFYKTTVLAILQALAADPGEDPAAPVPARSWRLGAENWGGGGKFVQYYSRAAGATTSSVGVTTREPRGDHEVLIKDVVRTYDLSSLFNSVIVKGPGGEPAAVAWDSTRLVHVKVEGDALRKDSGTDGTYDAGAFGPEHLTDEGGMLTAQFAPPDTAPAAATFAGGSAVNVGTSGATVTKTGGTGGAWDAGIFGNVGLAGYGGAVSAEIRVTHAIAFGLSHTDANANWTSIGWGVRANGDGTAQAILSGAVQGAPFYVADHDRLRVTLTPLGAVGAYTWEIAAQPTGSTTWTVRYAATVQVALSSFLLYLDTSLATAGATLTSMQLTAPAPGNALLALGLTTAGVGTDPSLLDIGVEYAVVSSVYTLRVRHAGAVVASYGPVYPLDWVRIDVAPDPTGVLTATIYRAPFDQSTGWIPTAAVSLAGQTFPLMPVGLVATTNASLRSTTFRTHAYATFDRADSIGAPWNLGRRYAAAIVSDDTLVTADLRRRRGESLLDSHAYPRVSYVGTTTGELPDGTRWQFRAGMLVPVRDAARGWDPTPQPLLLGTLNTAWATAGTPAWPLQKLELGDRLLAEGETPTYLLRTPGPETRAPERPSLRHLSASRDGATAAVDVGWSTPDPIAQWVELQFSRTGPDSVFGVYRFAAGAEAGRVPGLPGGTLFRIEIRALSEGGAAGPFGGAQSITTPSIDPADIGASAATHAHTGGDGSVAIAYGTLTGTPTVPTLSSSAPADVDATAAAAGSAADTSKSDHRHHLGAHTHADASHGGTVAHSALTGIGTDDHHAKSHTHNGDGSGTVPYSAVSGTPTLGTAAAKDIPASGDATSGQVVYGTDTRLTDSRAPTTHTHSLATGITDEGTAAYLNVPASGNAASGEVVKGSDTRLTDSRTPAAHKTSHATGGSDALSASDIGASATSHTHTHAATTGQTTDDHHAKSHVHTGDGSGTVAHSSLSGLTSGNDHTQYLLASLLTTNGDLLTRLAGAAARLAAGTAGQILGTSATPLPAWGALPYGLHGTGKTAYCTADLGGSIGSLAMVDGTAYAMPFYSGNGGTADRIGIGVTAFAASSAIRLGIYNDNGAGYPGTVLLDAGTVDSSASNADKEITISQILAPNTLYWLVAAAQGGGPTVRARANSANPMIGLTAVSNNQPGGYKMTSVSGALGTWSSTLSLANTVPNPYVRIT
jgi:hypothetical protein